MHNENAKKTANLFKFLWLLLTFFSLIFTGSSFAGSLKLAWNGSKSPGVGGYKIYYGLNKGNYIASIDAGKKLTYKLKGLTNGQKYYFAVTTYNKQRSIESKFSNEVRSTIPGVTIDFTPSISSGIAPLIVTFTPTAIGKVKKWKWKFSTSSMPSAKSKIPTVTFPKPGTYTVSLTVTGSNGVSTTKKKKIVVLKPGPVQAKALAAINASDVLPAKNSENTAAQALVAAYGFEENNGVVVFDYSGRGNQGSLQEAQRTKAGHYGKGLKFDGINDWVTVPDSDSLDFTSGYTLEAWVQPESIQRSAVLVKQQQQDSAYDLYAYEDSDLPFSSFDDGLDHNPISGQELLPIKKWTHMAATFDGTYQKLYVNGTLVTTVQSPNRFIKPSQGVLSIGGKDNGGDFFQGYIDEVRVYNYALSAKEIQRDLRTPISSPLR
jgi:PKD repeat protein